MKLTETSNNELYVLANKMKIPLNGIFSKDQLPKKLNKGFYIVNMADHNRGTGSHWSLFYYDRFNGDNYYFDSFGFPPPVDVEVKLGKYSYNKKQIQDINSEACGYYCIAFIKAMYSGKYDEFIKMFNNDPKHNEQILIKYLKV